MWELACNPHVGQHLDGDLLRRRGCAARVLLRCLRGVAGAAVLLTGPLVRVRLPVPVRQLALAVAVAHLQAAVAQRSWRAGVVPHKSHLRMNARFPMAYSLPLVVAFRHHNAAFTVSASTPLPSM